LTSFYLPDIRYFSRIIDKVFFFDNKIAIGQPDAAFWGYDPVSLRSITAKIFGGIAMHCEKMVGRNCLSYGFSGTFTSYAAAALSVI
jgi:hypothetical protein